MVIYTVGTFDMLHVGHLALLEHCRRLGSVERLVLPLIES
jgi:glycerol-3-phosphate cytidylyltransferase